MVLLVLLSAPGCGTDLECSRSKACPAGQLCVSGICTGDRIDPPDGGDGGTGDAEPPQCDDDGGVDLADVDAVFPHNGYDTGSALSETALRPTFHWTTVEGATRYELQLSDDCTAPGFLTCEFTSPSVEEDGSETFMTLPDPLVVSTSAPVGRRYYWRVRACEPCGCSGWTTPRYLDVGRLPNDFNGDGYSDLAIGAQNVANPVTSEGNVFVHMGGPGGPSTMPARQLDITPGGDRALFGNEMAVGDVNGDGYGDLIVGALQWDGASQSQGQAWFYLGSAGGLPSTPSGEFVNPEPQTNAFMAGAIAVGDLSANGFDDIAIGVSRHDAAINDQGRVLIYGGRAAGPNPNVPLVLDGPDPESLQFGQELAVVGDLTGDGIVELAVGMPFAGQGRVHIVPGSMDALDPTTGTTISADTGVSRLGTAIAGVGDLNGDGYAELVVGASGSGQVFVYAGAPTGVATTPTATWEMPAGVSSGDSFGITVTFAGDMNGDGADEALVGMAAPGDDGRALFYMGGTTLDITPVAFAPPSDQIDSRYSRSMASAGDVNGDGWFDLVVGAFRYTVEEANEGAVFLHLGADGPISSTPDMTLDNAVAAGSFSLDLPTAR